MPRGVNADGFDVAYGKHKIV